MKVLPLWAAWLLAKTGLIGLFCKSYSAKFTKLSTLQHIRSLTNNKDLQTVMTYNFGDFGVAPTGYARQINISMKHILDNE